MSSYTLTATPKLFKLFGLLLDIVGTIIIGMAVIRMNTHFHNVHSVQEFDEDLQNELARERKVTLVGVSLVFVGFLFIFGEELYTNIWKSGSSHAHK